MSKGEVSVRESTQGDAPGLARTLDLAAFMALILAVMLRCMSGGQDLDSLETAVIDSVTWLALAISLLRKFLTDRISFVMPGICLPFLAFLLFAGLAVLRAGEGGDAFQAGTLASYWLMDGLLFWLVLDLARNRQRCAALLTVLLGCGAVVIAFSLYQRGYALNYFTSVMEARPELVVKSAGENPIFQSLYWSRVRTMRVYGPLGAYPNTLAGFLVLLLPLFWMLALTSVSRGRKAFLIIVSTLGTLVLVYTGSRGGLVAAKAVEVVGMFYFAQARVGEQVGRWGGLLLDTFAYFILLSLVGLGLPLVVERILLGAEWEGTLLTVTTLRGLLLSGEVMVLAWLVIRERPRPMAGLAQSFGLAFLLVGVVLGVLLVVSPGVLGERIEAERNGFVEAFSLGTNTPGVRANYWRAGLKMVYENPVRGLGLDQYGTYYPAYKSITGWAVKRAHNNYIQLAADGGLPLLLSWLGIWFVFFRSKGGKVLPTEEVSDGEHAPERVFLFGGMAMGALALILTYLKFNGMHIEFFFNEIGGGPASVWPGNKGPALIHLFAHLVLLPAAGIGVLLVVSRELSLRKELTAVRLALRVGVAGLLIHFCFDFHFYVRVISSTLMVAAALALALGGVREGVVRLRGKRRTLCLVVVLVLLAGFGWRVPLAQWIRAEALAEVPYAGLGSRSATARLEAQIKIYQSVLAMNGNDAGTHRRIAELYTELCRLEAMSMVRQGMPREAEAASVRRALSRASTVWRSAAVAHARIAADLVPAIAAGHAHLARTLMLLKVGGDYRSEAAERFAEAHRLNPVKVGYLHWLGSIALERGQRAAARQYWQAALTLNANPRLTDERARLSEEECRVLTSRLKELR